MKAATRSPTHFASWPKAIDTALEKLGSAILSWIAEDEYLLTLAILSSNPGRDKFDRE
jgi:hypothetical protein